MKDSNMINIPVATETIITKDGGQRYLVKGEVTAYSVWPGGDAKELRSFATQSIDPIPISLVPFTGTTSWSTISNYYKETSNTFSKAEGWEQMNTQSALGVRRVTNMLDYKNKFVTATTVNASSGDISFTSFEAEFKGDWTYDQAKVFEDWAPTGKRYLKAAAFDGGTTISRTVKNTKVYTLSFWLKGEMPFMSGATFTLKSSYTNTATGWTYYEYEVTNGTNITITNLTGIHPFVYRSYCLDEIRCHYTESRMKTTTYDPVFGKTSECDENGRITYYEYDGLGRLKLIRDGSRNVIKTYEYNYKQ
jgi:YD repeat-containing protein